MYAVVRTGGKQYRVSPQDVILVEKLPGETGETIVLEDVLAVDDGTGQTIGAPRVSGASVAAEVIDQAKGPKVIVFKKKRRHNYRRKQGHRQQLTVLRITEILTSGKKPSQPKAAVKSVAKGEAKTSEPKQTETSMTAAAKRKPAAKKTVAKKTAAKKKPAAKKAAAKKPAAKRKTAAKKKPARKTAKKK